MPSEQLFPVPFYEDVVVLVGRDNEPYVAMKPLVENMGLDWKAQHSKLASKFRAVMVIITTTGADGKQYEMVCLPLRKLPAWMYSINLTKINPALRGKIGRYQDECDDVLWDYWSKGSATRPGAAPITVPQQLAAHRQRLALLKDLYRATDPALRRAMHEQLDHASRLLGLSTPALAEIGHETVPDHESPLLEDFWDIFDALQNIWGGKLNHARDPHLIAFNLPQVRTAAEAAKLTLPDGAELRRLLRASRAPRFVGFKAVNSAQNDRTMKCWIFEKEMTASIVEA
ncbi:MAG: phage antirepressor N-terminal domain-containing protein [Sterolibacterium sp.]|nr:phage antirepressor N-terminal domain-containing protein [Sterolibacterium sp.]